MAPTTDFSEWVVPDLALTLGGHTYTVSPPSVSRARQIQALAAASTARTTGAELPDPVRDVLAELEDTPLAAVTLGQGVYDQLVTDGVSAVVVQRMGYYGLHYWLGGKERADAAAVAMWGAHDGETAPAQAGRARAPKRKGAKPAA